MLVQSHGALGTCASWDCSTWQHAASAGDTWTRILTRFILFSKYKDLDLDTSTTFFAEAERRILYSTKISFQSRHKKKSKSLSEVKSFSSFSFSDVALDYKDYKVYSEHEKQQTLSQSDPSQLDQARDDSPEVSGDSHPQQQQQQQQPAKLQVPRLAMAQGSSSSRRQARAGFWSKSRSVDLWLREHFAGEDTAGPGREKLAGDTQHHIVFSKYPYYIHK